LVNGIRALLARVGASIGGAGTGSCGTREPPRVWWRVGYPASCCYTGVI
jgi:hypothetical protein